MPHRPAWDFAYAPVCAPGLGDEEAWTDWVVATHERVDAEALVRSLGLARVEATPLVARPPLFWTRVRTAQGLVREELEATLERAGIPVRYVASAAHPSMRLAPPLSFDGIATAKPHAWKARPRRPPVRDPSTEGRWFLGKDGVSVERPLCGDGAGTRLAVIDDDAAETERLPLDAEVLVGVTNAPRTSGHGSLLVAWAVGAIGASGGGFTGVAPAASPRLYVIPKPEEDAVSLACAIVAAADDGADVIVCATHIEGKTSPMLDDALAFATRLGRGGRGACVVFPTGRETSSARGHVHASLSLSLGDPASDPRALCIAPSGRDGGWFVYRDTKGRLRPFANRGPAVRWLAPGDDIADPFSAAPRMHHAESSGASAIAAGVMLLVLAQNPSLRPHEVDALLTATVDRASPEHEAMLSPLADPAEMLPVQRDRDGHNAKHGYGRLNATRACLAARDPVALSLVAIGEDGAARRWTRGIARAPLPYSKAFGRWLVRVSHSDAHISHSVRVLARHVRLLAADPRRLEAQAPGALARQVALLLRSLSDVRPRPSKRVAEEIETMTRCTIALTAGRSEGAQAFDRGVAERLADLWEAVRPEAGESRRDGASPFE